MLHISLCTKNAEECEPVVLTGKQKRKIMQKLEEYYFLGYNTV
jgi:hypothetical protein